MSQADTPHAEGLAMRIASTVLACLSLAIALPAIAGGPLIPPGAPSPTPGPEPRVPINDLPGGQGALHVISAPGSYYLADNIGSSGMDGVRIDTPGPVSIDGMGFTMQGTGGGSAFELVPHLDQEVHIEKVSVHGWDYGFHAPGPAVRHTGYGNITLKRGVIDSSSTNGIFAPESSVDMSDVRIHNSGQTGAIVGDDSRLVVSNIGSSGQDGVAMGDGGTIIDSTISGNMGVGVKAGREVVVVGSKIKENTAGAAEVGENAHFEEGYFDGYIIAQKNCTLIDTNIHMGIEPTPFTPIQLLGGGHHAEGNIFNFDVSDTSSLPAMVIKGDGAEFSKNRVVIAQSGLPAAAQTRNPPHFITWDGTYYDIRENTISGLLAGTEAGQLLGSRHMVENNLISAAPGATAQGFIGSADTSVIRGNTFMGISASNAVLVSGTGNYFAPLVDAGSAATSSKCDVNVVIEPTP